MEPEDNVVAVPGPRTSSVSTSTSASTSSTFSTAAHAPMDLTSWTSPQQVLAAFREHSADPYPDRIEPDRLEPDGLGPDRLAPQDPGQDAVTWLYHPADYPAALLHAIVIRGRTAATNVDYADTYRAPAQSCICAATQTTCAC